MANIEHIEYTVNCDFDKGVKAFIIKHNGYRLITNYFPAHQVAYVGYEGMGGDGGYHIYLHTNSGKCYCIFLEDTGNKEHAIAACEQMADLVRRNT